MSFLSKVIRVIKKIPFAKIPFVGGILNRYKTNSICMATHPRPRPFSLWSHAIKPLPLEEQAPPGEYTTWPMLTDRLFSARHIPPASDAYTNQLPEDTPYTSESPGQITDLFKREGEIKSGRSTILFMFFAQWFTDSVLRVDPLDRRKNTSNHNIDLCQIYGLSEETAHLLRAKEGGRLRSQIINNEEYLDYLGEIGNDGKWKVKDHYNELPYVKDKRIDYIMSKWDEKRKYKLYATGLERGNSSIGYVAISTLFMREHNRICKELKKINSHWDDERLFQTARMINNVILMKIVVNDYINHIAGVKIFEFDVTFAEKQDWYRTPWISLEFDMLYRWHGLVPEKITVGDNDIDHKQYRFNNDLLETVGFSAIIDASSRNRAGEISLKNVPKFLLGAEYQTIKMGRDFRLAPYNDYRKLFGEKPISSFEDLTNDRKLVTTLKELYGDIDKVEFIVGIFAEKHDEDRLFGDLMYAMVAYDAFTQIYTNPLLSKNIYTKETFTEYGLDLIQETNSVQDLADRNNQSGTPLQASFGS